MPILIAISPRWPTMASFTRTPTPQRLRTAILACSHRLRVARRRQPACFMMTATIATNIRPRRIIRAKACPIPAARARSARKSPILRRWTRATITLPRLSATTRVAELLGQVYTQLDPDHMQRKLISGQCTPVYPHQYVRTNTIFEVFETGRKAECLVGQTPRLRGFERPVWQGTGRTLRSGDQLSRYARSGREAGG